MQRYVAEWRRTITRLGRWVDFDNDYKTMDPAYMESIWWVFSQLWKKGLIYEGVLEPPKGKKPDDWEPRVQTLFKSTEHGDDVDRPVMKSDGSWTYFATDIVEKLGVNPGVVPILAAVAPTCRPAGAARSQCSPTISIPESAAATMLNTGESALAARANRTITVSIPDWL